MKVWIPSVVLTAFAFRCEAVTYVLAGGNENWPADKRAAIVEAMDEAVALYNANGFFDKALTANYNAGVPTAQAGYSGWIDFGGSISTRAAMHEMGHTMGVGTYGAWQAGGFNGTYAVARVRLYDGPSAGIGSDAAHFWPYGLNFDNEDSPAARVRHVKIVSAMRRDMGIVGDGDSDGIPDDWETFYFGGTGQSATSDGDGDGTNLLAEYQEDRTPKTLTTRTWNGRPGIWVWDTSTANWTGHSTVWPVNGSADAGYDNSAVFSGTPGMVTVFSGVVVTNIDFNVDGYMLSSSGLSVLTVAPSYPNTTTGYDPVPPRIGVSAGSTAMINCAVDAADGWRKSGAGTLRLSGRNTFIELYIDEGVVALTFPSYALPTNCAVTIQAGAKLALNFNGNQRLRFLSLGGVTLSPGTYSAATHPAYITGAGVAIVGSPIQWTGSVNRLWDLTSANWINDGAASAWVDSSGAIFGFGGTGPIDITTNITARSLTFTAPGYTLSSGSGKTLSLRTTRPNILGSADAVLQLPLAGIAGLGKQGSGRLDLRAVNTYTGNTTVDGGILSLTGNGAIYAGGLNDDAVLTVEGGGILELDRWGYGPNGAPRVQSLGGLDYNPARFVIDGGTVRFTGGAAGAPQDANEAQYGPGFTVGPGGAILDAAKANDVWTVKYDSRGYGPVLSNGGTLTLTGIGEGRFEKSLPGTGGLVKNGAGPWKIRQPCTYTGNTTINAGTLSVANGGALYTGGWNPNAVLTVNSGAVLELDTWGYGPVSGYRTQALGGLDYPPARFVINGGTVRCTGGANAAPENPAESPYGPGFTIGALGATFDAAKAGDTWTVKYDSRGGASVVSNGGMLTLTGIGDGVFDKELPGTGGVAKTGPGTWTLSRANTYTGQTTVTQGRLVLQTSSLANTATLAISSGAKVVLDFTGSDTVGALQLAGVNIGPGSYSASHPQYGSYFEGTGSITVPGTPNAYDAWAASFPGFSNAAFDFDFDGDGLANGIEAALGGNPMVRDAATTAPTASRDAASGLALVVRRNPAVASAIALTAEWDTQLAAAFSGSVAIGASDTTTAQGVVVDIDAPAAGYVTVRIPASESANGRLVARLRATRRP